jgi:O-succinylbenzoate synthase
MRCEASHQGKAFSEKFATSIGWIESLVLGTVVFALDHITTASTIEQLWTHASSYILPPETTIERPSEITRGAIVSASIETSLKWTGLGQLFDHCFQSKQIV